MSNKKYDTIQDFDKKEVKDMTRDELVKEIKDSIMQKIYELKEKGEFVDPFEVKVEKDPDNPREFIISGLGFTTEKRYFGEYSISKKPPDDFSDGICEECKITYEKTNPKESINMDKEYSDLEVWILDEPHRKILEEFKSKTQPCYKCGVYDYLEITPPSPALGEDDWCLIHVCQTPKGNEEVRMYDCCKENFPSKWNEQNPNIDTAKN